MRSPRLHKEDGDYGHSLGQEEAAALQLLLKYSLANAHYYCESADLTRPFPSRRPPAAGSGGEDGREGSGHQPSWEFVWNYWLSAALREVGLLEHCPALLQVGLAAAAAATAFAGI